MRRRSLLISALFAASCAPSSSPTSPTLAPTVMTNRIVVDGAASASEREDSIIAHDIAANGLTGGSSKTVTLSGTITDKGYPAWKVSSAKVTAGGVSTKTNSQGAYSLRLKPGTYTIKITKSKYSNASIRQSVSSSTNRDVTLAPVKPSGSTARCKDRTWSKSQNRSGTCSSHKGVAYWVCPGKLCR
jgi:hypothetical protein